MSEQIDPARLAERIQNIAARRVKAESARMAAQERATSKAPTNYIVMPRMPSHKEREQ